MNAPTRLLGMVDDAQYGSIVTDVYEHIPELLYPASVWVYAKMRHDSRLAAVLAGYSLQIRRAQWQLDGTGCRPEVTQLVADSLGLDVVGKDDGTGHKLRGVSWNDHLRSALRSLTFGHYPFAMQAEIGDDGLARLAVLAERLPATITAIHADPATGALLGIDQQHTNARGTPQIPANKLVFYSRDREGAAWQGTSLLRAAYAPWLLKREMMRVNAIANRRWGAGVPVMEAQPGTNPSPEQFAAAQRMASAARAGDQAGAAAPPGFVLKIVGLSGNIPDTPGFIRLLNQEISSSVLMPHLDLGTSETGARALGESFVDSWTLALEAEAEAIADTITRQGAARIVDWNWGTDELCPKVVVSGIGSRREITAESLQKLLAAGALSVDPKLEEWVRREYRLPQRDPDAPRSLPAGPPARLPDRPATQEEPPPPGEEVAAAAPNGVDYQALDTDYAQAVEQITAGWETKSGPLVTAIAAAVAAEAAGGALAGLAALAVPPAATAALTALVTGGLLDLAVLSARRAAAEAAPIAKVRVTLDKATRQRVTDTANATVNLIVAGYQSAATRVAIGQAGTGSTVEQVRDAITTALADLSRAKTSGLVAGNVSAAAGTVQGAAREQVFGDLPDGTRFRAHEEAEGPNTCKPCRKVNGKTYGSLAEALADYPAGRYRLCLGGSRCRGFLIPVTA
ncbi:DUF935 family protein [Micromonospora sp. NPDC006766]|uniref:phage portal protein family protein n=1 Tax=Micromonospora sp. NPDC006766 TaxID=3154778 RepID=UPI003400AA99